MMTGNFFQRKKIKGLVSLAAYFVILAGVAVFGHFEQSAENYRLAASFFYLMVFINVALLVGAGVKWFFPTLCLAFLPDPFGHSWLLIYTLLCLCAHVKWKDVDFAVLFWMVSLSASQLLPPYQAQVENYAWAIPSAVGLIAMLIRPVVFSGLKLYLRKRA